MDTDDPALAIGGDILQFGLERTVGVAEVGAILGLDLAPAVGVEAQLAGQAHRQNA